MALKNKPGGMAWITGFDSCGAETMNGQAVKTTVYLAHVQMWQLDPYPKFVATKNVILSGTNTRAAKGTIVELMAIPDDKLIPWKDDVDDDSVDESQKFYPKVPKLQKIGDEG
jgi:hypothetical protein